MTKNIISQAQEFFNNEILESAKNPGDVTITVFGLKLFKKLLVLGGMLLQVFVLAMDDKIRRNYIVVGDVILKNLGLRKRDFFSLFGKIPIYSSYYWAKGFRGIYSVDEIIALPEQIYSYNLEKLAILLFANAPLEQAELILKEIFSIELCDRVILDIFKKISKLAGSFRAQQAPSHTLGEEQICVISIDGKGVPMRPEALKGTKGKNGKARTKQAGLGVIYSIKKNVRKVSDFIASLRTGPEGREKKDDKDKKPSGPVCKKIFARLGDKVKVFEYMLIELYKRQAFNYQRTVIITDGEKYLENLAMKYLRRFTHILDIFHVLERLWECSHLFYKKGSQQARQYVDRKLELLLTGRFDEFMTGLKNERNKLKGDKRKIVNSHINYFKPRREMMRYDEYLKKGFPIGSGAVESACKNLVKQRMEGSGMFWSFEGAQAMLDIRAIHLNGDLDEFFEFYVRECESKIRSMKKLQKEKLFAAKRRRKTGRTKKTAK